MSPLQRHLRQIAIMRAVTGAVATAFSFIIAMHLGVTGANLGNHVGTIVLLAIIVGAVTTGVQLALAWLMKRRFFRMVDRWRDREVTP